MNDADTLRAERLPFEARQADRDYSGLSISDRYSLGENLEKSFFNGVNLSNCAFSDVQLNNTEFSEAKVERSLFAGVNLSGSDLVDCEFRDVAFTDCSFEKGEWREATFVNCTFVTCDFAHTTVTLCKFINCQIDETSLASAEHRSVYFNVFTGCQFGKVVRDAVFASRNFGTPAQVGDYQIVDPASGTSIEQACLLNNHGHLRVEDLADVAGSICSSLAERQQRRNSTLTFFSKIVRTITDERRISATSLLYLEDLLTRFAATVEEQDLLMTTMSAVMEIRSGLFTIVSESASAGAPEEDLQSIRIHFAPTYARHQVEVLRDALAESAGLSPTALDIEDLRTGSTIIDLASTTVVSIGAFMVGLNFVLRQATVTVQLVGSLKRKLGLTGRPRKKSRMLARNMPTKAHAILKANTVAPELMPVRAIVRRTGRILVQMDERATVTVLAKEPKRRR